MFQVKRPKTRPVKRVFTILAVAILALCFLYGYSIPALISIDDSSQVIAGILLTIFGGPAVVYFALHLIRKSFK
ncbi:hypothetical protein MWH03_00550 [Klebsiella pneumoniae]|nr:hypothetical protein [Klebsiella pneumoniae]